VREPGVAFKFQVLIDGAELSITQVSGLALAADKATLVREEDRGTKAGLRFSATPLPPCIVLRRALDGSRDLFDWRREAVAGEPALRDVEIVQLDRAGLAPVARWRLRGCFPLRWGGPCFDARAGAAAFEELELACAELEWV